MSFFCEALVEHFGSRASGFRGGFHGRRRDSKIEEPRMAQAQQAQQDYQINPGLLRPHRGPALRDVWGPPKMPPEPKDFGPHFDFPSGGSQNLTCGPPGSQYFCGAPSEAPYPN